MAGRGDGWLAKRSIVSNEGCGGGGLTVRGGKSSNKPKNGCGDVGGVEKISLTGSKLITNVEVCLDGCDGGSGREVNGGGVVLGVLKRWSRDVLDETIGESGGDTIGLDGGAVSRILLKEMGERVFGTRMEPAFDIEGNRRSAECRQH
ncbi:hypothetical protein Tco_1153908 [Tanacetum coccineum]